MRPHGCMAPWLLVALAVSSLHLAAGQTSPIVERRAGGNGGNRTAKGGSCPRGSFVTAITLTSGQALSYVQAADGNRVANDYWGRISGTCNDPERMQIDAGSTFLQDEETSTLTSDTGFNLVRGYASNQDVVSQLSVFDTRGSNITAGGSTNPAVGFYSPTNQQPFAMEFGTNVINGFRVVSGTVNDYVIFTAIPQSPGPAWQSLGVGRTAGGRRFNQTCPPGSFITSITLASYTRLNYQNQRNSSYLGYVLAECSDSARTKLQGGSNGTQVAGIQRLEKATGFIDAAVLGYADDNDCVARLEVLDAEINIKVNLISAGGTSGFFHNNQQSFYLGFGPLVLNGFGGSAGSVFDSIWISAIRYPGTRASPPPIAARSSSAAARRRARAPAPAPLDVTDARQPL